MVRPGGKPVPTAIKNLLGNPGKRARNKDEPQYEVKVPDCPSHMDVIATEEWNRIGPLLAEYGLLTEVDMAALMVYCRAFSLFVEADKQVQKYGSMLVSKRTSNFYQSPYVNQMSAAIKQMMAITTEFGLTPSSRARLKALSGGIEINATIQFPWEQLTGPPDSTDPIEQKILDVESKVIEGNGKPKIGSKGNGKKP